MRKMATNQELFQESKNVYIMIVTFVFIFNETFGGKKISFKNWPPPQKKKLETKKNNTQR